MRPRAKERAKVDEQEQILEKELQRVAAVLQNSGLINNANESTDELEGFSEWAIERARIYDLGDDFELEIRVRRKDIPEYREEGEGKRGDE